MLSPCRAAASSSGVERTKVRERAVRQHDVLLEHVIDRLAVQRPIARRWSCWPSCRRPWRGSPTTHRARSAGRCGRSMRVQVVEHDAGFDPRPALVGVDLEHPVQVLRGVEHEPGADRLAGLRGAAAARRDRDAVLGGDRDGADHRLGGLGNDDAQRLDLVDAGVGGVKRARDRVEADLAVDSASSSRWSARLGRSAI